MILSFLVSNFLPYSGNLHGGRKDKECGSQSITLFLLVLNCTVRLDALTVGSENCKKFFIAKFLRMGINYNFNFDALCKYVYIEILLESGE